MKEKTFEEKEKEITKRFEKNMNELSEIINNIS